MPQPPADLVRRPAQLFRHGAGHTGHIEDRMALEDLRQAVGQIAGKTFSGTLVQLKSQFRLSFSFGAADQHDVIGAFLSTAEQGVEKRLRAFRGEHAVKKF